MNHRAEVEDTGIGAATSVVLFHKGRGVGTNHQTRFAAWNREADRDFLDHAALEGEPPRRATTVTEQSARSIISRNTSPDIPFDQSINPYQGCEHGCVYCYARPSHAFIGLSAGLDFETRIFAKTNAAALLRAELNRPAYRPAHIALGANTDPYQPAERKLEITRDILHTLADFNLPVAITTKSALVVRDIDILAPMAARGLARVFISLGTLDNGLARILEPRANSPARRLEAIRRLADAGIPVGVFTSPLIPGLNDKEMEKILEAAVQAGATQANYVILRLPLEVRDLFVEWLEHHFPLRASHVMSLVRQMRDGRDYDPDFTTRMRGTGLYADLIRQRFRLACSRLGLRRERVSMDISQFRRPDSQVKQLALF